MSNSKYFLACKKVVPNFSKYEFFYLLEDDEKYKKYLMKNQIVKRDLFNATDDDFKIYNELYSNVVNEICNEISANGKNVWMVEANDISNKSQLFSLNKFYEIFICKDIKREEFEDNWEYEWIVKKAFQSHMMESIYNTLNTMSLNDNISNFISDYINSREINSISK